MIIVSRDGCCVLIGVGTCVILSEPHGNHLEQAIEVMQKWGPYMSTARLGLTNSSTVDGIPHGQAISIISRRSHAFSTQHTHPNRHDDVWVDRGQLDALERSKIAVRPVMLAMNRISWPWSLLWPANMAQWRASGAGIIDANHLMIPQSVLGVGTMSIITDYLIATMRALNASETCRHILAEYANVRHSGFEQLLQAHLLWSFNGHSPRQFVADLERGFPPKTVNRVDFVILEEKNRNQWWQCYETGQPAEMLRLCRALVEMKLVRDQYAPYYVGLDINKLREMWESPENASLGMAEKEYLELVLVGGVFDIENIPDPVAKIADRKKHFWDGFQHAEDPRNKLSRETHLIDDNLWILYDEPVPSESQKRGFIKAMLLDLAPALNRPSTSS